MLELDLSIMWKRFAIFCGRDSALVDSQSSFFFSGRFPKQVAGLFVLIQPRTCHIPIAMQIAECRYTFPLYELCKLKVQVQVLEFNKQFEAYL